MSFAKVGDEIRVNTRDAGLRLNGVGIAKLDGGGFVVNFVNEVAAEPPSFIDGYSYSQIFTSTGALVGGEIATGAQDGWNVGGPVTGLVGGGFAVVAPNNGAFGQIFNASGELVHGFSFGNLGRDLGPAAISTLSDGGFVVTWEDAVVLPPYSYPYRFDHALRGQVFDSSGVKVGAEFRIDATPQIEESASSVTGLSDGRFVVTWTEDGSPGTELRGQIFLADGAESGGEFHVNTTAEGQQFDSAVTSLSGGRFVVTWTDTSETGGYLWQDIRGQIFAADGTKSGGEFLANTSSAGVQRESAVTGLADGRFIVVWKYLADIYSPPTAIRGQLFTDTGLKSGEEFVINPPARADLTLGLVTALDNGNFVVAWTESYDVYTESYLNKVKAQIFDPTRYSGSSANDTYYGGNFADTIAGNGGMDTLYGGAGDDMMSGNAGDDWMNGGAGSDTVDYGAAGSSLYIDLRAGFQSATGGFGTDNISGFENITGGAFDDVLTGNELANDISGGESNDQLYGLAGGDTLRGGNGDDYLNAGDGNDTVFGGDGNDVISGGAGGTDTLNGEAGADFITGDAGVDIIDGGAGDDIWLGGGDGDDVIAGGAGNDRIDGGADDDTLTGGLGRDYLSGGLGSDRFVFNVSDFQAFIIDTVGDFHSVPGTDFDAIRLQGSAVDYSFSNVNGAARIEHIATLGVIYLYNFTVAQLEDQTEYFV